MGRHAATCSFVDAAPPRAYSYLLGQYLGDGTIASSPRADRLLIATTDVYPGIRGEVIEAIEAVMPGRRVGFVPKQGCTVVSCYSTHWTCLFPQHGPGRKHERPIVLERWQRTIAIEAHPDAFLRGLVHSDGCRCINTVRGRGREYRYVRYLFSNRSRDIRELFREGCAAVGVESRPNGPWSMSVARRESVAILERLIGPKC